MTRTTIAALAIFSLLLAAGHAEQAGSQPSAKSPDRPIPRSVRLYVFDCGTLDVADIGRFRLKREEVATDKLSVACYLVAHPRGALIWDTGAVPDGAVKPGNVATRTRIVLPNSQERFVTIARPLGAQLAATGYAPADITYLALSHYHYDHTANSNQFARATWLVRPIEHDAMFSANPPDLTQPSSYNALRASKTVLIKTDEHDVFGDGSVIIKLAAGHTPGHQVLFVKLAKTGPVLLTGDLYHYPEERTLNRLPTFEADERQTAAARTMIEAFLKKTGAALWIQHDFTANAKLRKAPEYYE
jgi:glyoxylase-like metal-dependent hydrolase (beta-lactamase superfamily II)